MINQCIPMKIAVVVDGLERGGTERQTLYMARELACRGWDVELIHYHKLCQDWEFDPSEFRVNKVTFLARNKTVLRFFVRLYHHIKHNKYDVVYAVKSGPCIFGCLAAWLAGVRVILAGYRTPYQLHFPFRIAHRLVNAITTAWIVNSRYVAQSMSVALSIRPEKFFVVNNGIDTQNFVSKLSHDEAKGRIGLSPQDSVVSIIGMLRPEKDHALFLEMGARLLKSRPQTQFLLIGDGPLRSALESYAFCLGISHRVHFLGMRADIPDLLAATDVSVMASQYEGLSNSIVESMSQGVPVVTTSYPGVEEVITNGREGFIVATRTPPDMAHAVRRILDDKNLRAHMGQHGRERVERQFSMSAMADAICAVFDAYTATVNGTACQSR